MAGEQRPDLSIVIPAYHEERRIGQTLDELSTFLATDKFFSRKNIEILVIAADTPDSTHEIARSKEKLFEQKHITFKLLLPGLHVGKGRDVQYGMLRARGRRVIFMDADLATPLRHLEQFYKLCERDSDIVIGTRDLLRYRPSKFRNIFSFISNRYYQLASGLHIEDTQCGFKMFTQSAAQLCFSKLTIMGWRFDLEILAIAQANHLAIKPVRIDDWQNKPHSTYTENVAQIFVHFIQDFAHITTNVRKGKYVKN